MKIASVVKVYDGDLFLELLIVRERFCWFEMNKFLMNDYFALFCIIKSFQIT